MLKPQIKITVFIHYHEKQYKRQSISGRAGHLHEIFIKKQDRFIQ